MVQPGQDRDGDNGAGPLDRAPQAPELPVDLPVGKDFRELVPPLTQVQNDHPISIDTASDGHLPMRGKRVRM